MKKIVSILLVLLLFSISSISVYASDNSDNGTDRPILRNWYYSITEQTEKVYNIGDTYPTSIEHSRYIPLYNGFFYGTLYYSGTIWNCPEPGQVTIQYRGQISGYVH